MARVNASVAAMAAWLCATNAGCTPSDRAIDSQRGVGPADVRPGASSAAPLAPQQDGIHMATQRTSLKSMIQLALEDAARRTRLDVAALTVALSESVTWPDGSLGCPQPGMGYTQALVPGYRIRIRSGDEILEYHCGERGPPIYCPPSRVTLPVTADPRK